MKEVVIASGDSKTKERQGGGSNRRETRWAALAPWKIYRKGMSQSGAALAHLEVKGKGGSRNRIRD